MPRLALACYLLAAAVLAAAVVVELTRDDVDVPPAKQAPIAKVSPAPTPSPGPTRRRRRPGRGSRWG